MTCDNDYDQAVLKANSLSKAVIVMVHGHSQKVPKSRSPEVKIR